MVRIHILINGGTLMFRLSAKTDYALRAMMDLAQHPGERTTLPAIA